VDENISGDDLDVTLGIFLRINLTTGEIPTRWMIRWRGRLVILGEESQLFQCAAGEFRGDRGGDERDIGKAGGWIEAVEYYGDGRQGNDAGECNGRGAEGYQGDGD